MLTVTCTLSCIPALRCRQRFSLLLYGFGSKRSLLEAFADETLTDGGVLACDGLSPGVNAKQVHSILGEYILGGGGI
jgi:origin recognition complex subunit 2